jgi:hypothetical protein
VIDAGYFPKAITPRPDWLAAPSVIEICSVSLCVSSGPPDWIQQWIHNSFGWCNRVADVARLEPPTERGKYRVFAYRLHPEFHREGHALPVVIPEDVTPDPIPSSFRRLGFDAVSHSMTDVLGLECSPLSCCGTAAALGANEWCLFPTLDAAVDAARTWSVGGAEPGDYYVVEVLEQQSLGV